MHLRAPAGARRTRTLLLSVVGSCVASAAVVGLACNDSPPPPSGPGNIIIDNSMQDAVAQMSQDGSIQYGAQGIGDAGDGAAYFDSAASTSYIDSGSPNTACSACKCDQRVGYCLENGSSVTSNAPPQGAFCGLSRTTSPAVGCNPLPECDGGATCECILAHVQPPLPCYPECTSSGGFFDVFCSSP